MKNTLKILILFSLATFFLSLPAIGAKKFTIGVENLNYYPLYSWNGKKYSGFSKDFFDGFAKSKGYVFRYKGLPVKRLYKSLFKGQVDFKFPDSPYWAGNQKKGKNITYSDGVVEYIDGTVVRPENKGKGIGFLKKLGLVRGFTAWDYLGEIKSGKVQVVENNSFEGLLKQAMKDRISGAYVNVAVSNYVVNQVLKQKDALVFDPGLPHTKSSYQISTVKYPDVLKELNAYIRNNQADIKRLKNKYSVSID